jgi:hypothetical protein
MRLHYLNAHIEEERRVGEEVGSQSQIDGDNNVNKQNIEANPRTE